MISAVLVYEATEVSLTFLRGMCDRMAMSFQKYGPVAKAYPQKVDAIGSLFIRLLRYLGPERFKAACDAALAAVPVVESSPHRRVHGNTEYLMDAANFAMIEFMHPRHLDAHFAAEDSSASPGRLSTQGVLSQAANTHEQELTRIGYRYGRDGD